MSKFQKRRHRLRLRAVDSVVDTLNNALAKRGQTLPAVERWLSEMPREEQMKSKDKYTMFDRKAKRYRKGVHSELKKSIYSLCLPCLDGHATSLARKGGGRNFEVETYAIVDFFFSDVVFFLGLPKWTRVSQRVNPPGY